MNKLKLLLFLLYTFLVYIVEIKWRRKISRPPLQHKLFINFTDAQTLIDQEQVM